MVLPSLINVGEAQQDIALLPFLLTLIVGAECC